jgi:hypothetical protein
MIIPYYFILDKIGNQFTFETMDFDRDNLILSLHTFEHELNKDHLEYVIGNRDISGSVDRLDVYDIIEVIDYDKDRSFLKIKLEQLDTDKFDMIAWLRDKKIDFVLDLIK